MPSWVLSFSFSLHSDRLQFNNTPFAPFTQKEVGPLSTSHWFVAVFGCLSASLLSSDCSMFSFLCPLWLCHQQQQQQHPRTHQRLNSSLSSSLLSIQPRHSFVAFCHLSLSLSRSCESVTQIDINYSCFTGPLLTLCHSWSLSPSLALAQWDTLRCIAV